MLPTLGALQVSYGYCRFHLNYVLVAHDSETLFLSQLILVFGYRTYSQGYTSIAASPIVDP